MFLNAARFPSALHSSGGAGTRLILSFRHISGTKAFSSCSTADLEQFLRRDGGRCLLHGPPLQGSSPRRSPTCGNGVVERGEQCDCGSAEVCTAASPYRALSSIWSNEL